MRSVDLKVLKKRLSEYARLAASGETILVTDHDRVVAELVPPRPSRSPIVADALLSEGLREGWLRAPLIVGEGPPPRMPVMPAAELLAELISDRGYR
jgi:antitoxin (DNA-binding transcriptional repressor) of toxin-antitoxin stability system